MRLKYPLKKYVLPGSLLVVNTLTLIGLGNHFFTFLAISTTLFTYVILRLASKRIEKKDEEIRGLKRSLESKC